jgi:diaminopimelate epimerase
VSVDGGRIAVEMGPARPLVPVGTLEVTAGGTVWPAIGVEFPNPHAVVFVEDLAQVGSLTEPPLVRPTEMFQDGVNVEFVVVQSGSELSFRVHERGVGETRSCGTGACAVAWAYWQRLGEPAAASQFVVDVPGGRLYVDRRPDGHWVLGGPTEFVGSGLLTNHWWKDNE